MKYLKKFDTHLEYESYIADEPILPNVSICADFILVDKHHVHYSPYMEYNAPLKFTSSTGQSIGLEVRNWSSDESLYSYHPNLEVSYDGVNWETWTGESQSGDDDLYYLFDDLSFDDHDTIYVRGYNPQRFCDGSDDWDVDIECKFLFSDDDVPVGCEGNIMSLIGKTATELPCRACFYGLFESCRALTTAPELPATKVVRDCYCFMFRNCTSLTAIPELPATNWAEDSHESMFRGCTSLTTASVNQVYRAEFTLCSSLASVTISDSVQKIESSAFNNCTALMSITYTGTSDQWRSLPKEDSWDLNVPAPVIHCLGDGGDVVRITQGEVRYLNAETGQSLAPEEPFSGLVGTEVTKTAINIPGYVLDGENTKTITLAEDSESNLITFFYFRIPYENMYISMRTNDGEQGRYTRTPQSDVYNASGLQYYAFTGSAIALPIYIKKADSKIYIEQDGEFVATSWEDGGIIIAGGIFITNPNLVSGDTYTVTMSNDFDVKVYQPSIG